MTTKQKIDIASEQGRLAIGKTYIDCPYGHDQQSERDAWCGARIKAEKAAQPFIKRMLFGGNPLSILLGWVIFFATIAVIYKLFELIFGCATELGRMYC